jgi:hypothetical protein
MLVSIHPGDIKLVVIPLDPYSLAIDFVNPADDIL